MYLCVRGINVPSQESERSCICVLKVHFIKVPVPSQESERSCICVLGVHFIEVPVPSQESERSCICVLGISMYQDRKVSSHVFVC
jgi:hypothetical protein